MQNIVLAIVIIISILAHVWVFRFMRFKIDEGCVLRLLKDNDLDDGYTIESIASEINLSLSRVERACSRSKLLILVAGRVTLLN